MASLITDFKDLIGIGSKPKATVYDGILIARTTSLDGLEFDASISENHSSEVEYPTHPVEFGADINDHRIIKPRKFTMNGIIANFQLIDFKQFSNEDASALDRMQVGWQTLIELQTTGDPFEVISLLDILSNMQILTITTSQNKDSASWLDFTATLQEIIITETDVVTLPASAFPDGAVREQASSNVDLGTKQPQPVTPTIEQAANKSLSDTLAEVQ